MVLGKFMKSVKMKRPEMVERDWFFHWDNSPVQAITVVKNWHTTTAIQVLPLTRTIYLIMHRRTSSCCRKAKEEQAGATLSGFTPKSPRFMS
jgi:hypothetical protein